VEVGDRGILLVDSSPLRCFAGRSPEMRELWTLVCTKVGVVSLYQDRMNSTGMTDGERFGHRSKVG
jgi:hypothetical protein